MTDLLAEMRAIEMTLPAMRALFGMGVPREVALALHVEGDLAVAQVDLLRGGLFQFGGPDRRLILAVREHGELIDLVAMASHDENEWALRAGQAEFLGGELIDRAATCEWRELRLFGTPMGWLRGGGRGVCVLDWSASALGALRGLGSGITLVCDPGAKAKLQAMLAHGGLPLVAEDRPMIGRAA